MKDDFIDRIQTDVRNEQSLRDGIPQIAVGLLLILAMMMIHSGNPAFFVVFIPLMPILSEKLRKQFTYPRVGYAKLPDKGKRRAAIVFIFALILALGIGMKVITRNNRELPEISQYVGICFMGTIAVTLAALTIYRYIVEKRVIYLYYGLFIVPLFLVIWLLHLPKSIVMLIVLAFGLLNFIYGVLALLSFIRKNPVLLDEN
jgi:hypothetical protein